VSPATDLYAVGMILYEMLAGELPLEESDSPRRSSSHLRERCPGLPAAMEVILARALDPSSSKRFSSADEMSVALRALQTQLPVPNEESMMAATNPRVLLPTPKAGSATVDAISPPRPSAPKALYVPPPHASPQHIVNSEAPTTPIHSSMPPLLMPKMTKSAPRPETEVMRPTAPAPIVHKTTHPAPQAEPSAELIPERPITERRPPTSRAALWIAILLGGLLALGLAILFKLESIPQPTSAAPVMQEV
jgi:serine/threonine protein kinase